MSRTARITIGVGLCLALIVFFCASAARSVDARGQAWWTELGSYLLGHRRTVAITLAERTTVVVGDPVFAIDPNGTLRQVGEVWALAESGQIVETLEGEVVEARLLLYPSPLVTPNFALTLHRTPTSLGWVVERILSPQRRAEIEAELRQLLEAEREAWLRELAPLARDGLRQMLEVVEVELPRAVEAHRETLTAIGQRYYREVVQAELLPLGRETIVPALRARAEPVVREVGRELWQRVSLWRWSWRVLYDATPLLPERKLTEREWERFVAQEALPVIEQHAPQLARALADALADIARDDRLERVLDQSIQRLLSDQELRRTLSAIVRQAVADNPRFRETVERVWRDPQHRQTLDALGDRVEPTLRRIGDKLFGTRETGVTPEFAAVLRLQILGKDKRWLLLTPEPGPSLPTGQALRVQLP